MTQRAEIERLVERCRGASAYLADRVGLKMTLDRDQEELLVADLSQAADALSGLIKREEELREALDALMRRVEHWFDGDEREWVAARAALNPKTEGT